MDTRLKGLADRHVLVIDDPQCFTGQNDYRSLKSLEGFVLESHPNWIIKVKDDIIRTHADTLVK